MVILQVADSGFLLFFFLDRIAFLVKISSGPSNGFIQTNNYPLDVLQLCEACLKLSANISKTCTPTTDSSYTKATDTAAGDNNTLQQKLKKCSGYCTLHNMVSGFYKLTVYVLTVVYSVSRL